MILGHHRDFAQLSRARPSDLGDARWAGPARAQGASYLRVARYSSRSAASWAVRPASWPSGISDVREGRSSSTVPAARATSRVWPSGSTTPVAPRLAATPADERPSVVGAV